MLDRAPIPTPVKVKLVSEVWGVMQSFQAARKNVLEIIPEVATRQAILSGKTAIVRWHMVMDPTALRRILKDNLANYPKSDVTKNMLKPAIGDSIFIAEGESWHWQRRAAAPVFAHRNITNLVPIMSAAAQSACNRLKHLNQADVFHEMTAATFEVISNVTFGGDDRFDVQQIHKGIDDYIDTSMRVSLFDIIGLPAWVPRLSRLFPPKALRDMKRIATASVEDRKSKGAPKDAPDLLDLLLAGVDPETKRTMNTAELRDNLLTFIVAGHETTALTLSWALYLLAFDPKIQDKLYAEVGRVVQGDIATANELSDLVYTEQVIKEALRLYPPAAFLSRTAQDSDVLCEREIKAKDTVMLPIYALHRSHLHWEDPDQFDPDRFAPDAKYDNFSYLPFGHGPRICIGAQFAITEAKIILASLIKNYRFESIPDKNPKPVMVLTLRPEGGVHLKIHKR